MHPFRRVLLRLALASPVLKLTLFCLDLVLWHYPRGRKALATRPLL
ncbi:MAG: hypothetical protein ACXWML_09605 [Candidatus Binataceae bacterium]